MTLTGNERARLRAMLADAGLSDGEKGWDSLDVMSALGIAQYALGITITPGRLRPQDLRDPLALEAAIEGHGVRGTAHSRLQIDFAAAPGNGAAPPGTGAEGEEISRARRRLEYRLMLAFPSVRAAVSRAPQLSVRLCAEQPHELPLADRLLELLGVPEPAAPVQAAAAVPMPGPFAGRSGGGDGHAVERIEAAVRAFVTRWQGALWAPASPVVEIAQLRKLGYYDAHPEQVLELGPEAALLPAGCLNSFGLLGSHGRTLGTHTATVFRRELRYDERSGRWPAFTVREVLWCASSGWGVSFSTELEGLVAGLAAGFGLDGRWVPAGDPFFMRGGDHGSKREFLVATPHGDIALASVNQHGSHFVSRGYGAAGQVTGCAGLGLERWLLAIGERG